LKVSHIAIENNGGFLRVRYLYFGKQPQAEPCLVICLVLAEHLNEQVLSLKTAIMVQQAACT